jgi:hypothetical protein
MPDHQRRQRNGSGRRQRPRPPRNHGLGTSNQDRQELLSGSDEEQEQGGFRGLGEMEKFLRGESAEQGGEEAAAATELTRPEAAVKAAHLTYLEGVELHGEDASWETLGSNQGPLVDQMEADNNAGDGGYEWCGMFIGHSYKKAGIRDEILRRLVFWSGYRLHLFFTEGRYIDGSFGDWCTAHQTVQIGAVTGEDRKAALDAFAPQAGDIALFRSDYSHVGMVTSYDSATGTLEIIEGNRGDRVQATAYDTGDNQITFLGRFNDADYDAETAIDQDVIDAPSPEVDHGGAGAGGIG